ncbi:MAG: helix-turn-helix domain-containing protein [Actinobacteria bacterium]|nr:helix-turn-helix domain-containing protein [Actinomycetota bacterium]
MTPQKPEWLNTSAAAEMLGITPRTLYKLVDQGKVPGYRMGRVIRFQLSDILEAIEGFRIEPGSLQHLYQEEQ